MPLLTESYSQQAARWPQQGRVILAQFDDDSIVVYQAYRPAIGRFAAENGFFGGPFKLTRMTWIKPNFLWMMYRSGWGTKEGQETVLAIRMRRKAFDQILGAAIHSSYKRDIYESRPAWKRLVDESDVRLQWDPDHDPQGGNMERRAIQLGLRGETIAKYAREWVIDIQDISTFVAYQRSHAMAGEFDKLTTPTEHVYPVTPEDVSQRLGISNTPQNDAT